MSKDIREYLKYYLGCECMMTRSSYYAVHELHLSVKRPFTLSGKPFYHFIENNVNAEIKPILRKLESMTEEEALQIAKNSFYHNEKKYPDSDYKVSREGSVYVVNLNNDWWEKELRVGLTTGNIWYTNPTVEDRVHHAFESFHYLLSKGFDLFNLIESGLALDKDTIKQ